MTTDLLEGKDPVAVEGFKLALESVDLVLAGLLSEIQVRVDALDKANRSGEPGIAAIGSLLRLTVQKQLLEHLHTALPKVLLEGDVASLRGVVG